jgi:hypothetical protein
MQRPFRQNESTLIDQLRDLHQQRNDPARAGLPAGRTTAKLVNDRLAQPDDYGNLQITERGQNHLRRLEHSRLQRRHRSR